MLILTSQFAETFKVNLQITKKRVSNSVPSLLTYEISSAFFLIHAYFLGLLNYKMNFIPRLVYNPIQFFFKSIVKKINYFVTTIRWIDIYEELYQS